MKNRDDDLVEIVTNDDAVLSENQVKKFGSLVGMDSYCLDKILGDGGEWDGKF